MSGLTQLKPQAGTEIPGVQHCTADAVRAGKADLRCCRTGVCRIRSWSEPGCGALYLAHCRIPARAGPPARRERATVPILKSRPGWPKGNSCCSLCPVLRPRTSRADRARWVEHDDVSRGGRTSGRPAFGGEDGPAPRRGTAAHSAVRGPADPGGRPHRHCRMARLRQIHAAVLIGAPAGVIPALVAVRVKVTDAIRF